MLWCEVGSTITDGSTSPCCIPFSSASTNSWNAGPAGNTSGYTGANRGRENYWPEYPIGIPDCSRTGISVSSLQAGQCEPCKPRGLRTVLRAAAGETPAADSPTLALAARKQREHQRPPASVLPERNRPLGVHSSRARCGSHTTEQPSTKDTWVQDPRRKTRRTTGQCRCRDHHLRPSHQFRGPSPIEAATDDGAGQDIQG